MTSYDLYKALERLDLIDWETLPCWWPDYGDFAVVPEAILVQQSKWEKVRQSVRNLEELGLWGLEELATGEQWKIASAIVPSGLYNQKAKRIVTLCRGIRERFGDFETFRSEATREWLLTFSGIGEETADAILCYGCKREVMVADRYTARLLAALGHEMESYQELQAWLADGVAGYEGELTDPEGTPLPLNRIYALFHGMIVEYGKRYAAKSGVETAPLGL